MPAFDVQFEFFFRGIKIDGVRARTLKMTGVWTPGDGPYSMVCARTLVMTAFVIPMEGRPDPVLVCDSPQPPPPPPPTPPHANGAEFFLCMLPFHQTIHVLSARLAR